MHFAQDQFFRTVTLLVFYWPGPHYLDDTCQSLTKKQSSTMKLLDPTDLLTLDAHSLQERMKDGSLTAVDLVTSCLAQIRKHDDRLRAIISVAPRDLLLKRAQQLDQERALRYFRSDLHGIPILVKVRTFRPVAEAV